MRIIRFWTAGGRDRGGALTRWMILRRKGGDLSCKNDPEDVEGAQIIIMILSQPHHQCLIQLNFNLIFHYWYYYVRFLLKPRVGSARGMGTDLELTCCRCCTAAYRQKIEHRLSIINISTLFSRQQQQQQQQISNVCCGTVAETQMGRWLDGHIVLILRTGG